MAEQGKGKRLTRKPIKEASFAIAKDVIEHHQTTPLVKTAASTSVSTSKETGEMGSRACKLSRHTQGITKGPAAAISTAATTAATTKQELTAGTFGVGKCTLRVCDSFMLGS